MRIVLFSVKYSFLCLLFLLKFQGRIEVYTTSCKKKIEVLKQNFLGFLSLENPLKITFGTNSWFSFGKINLEILKNQFGCVIHFTSSSSVNWNSVSRLGCCSSSSKITRLYILLISMRFPSFFVEQFFAFFLNFSDANGFMPRYFQ